MNDATNLHRLKSGTEHLRTLGPRATAEMPTDLAKRIGGLPTILGLLAEYQRFAPVAVTRAGACRFPLPALRVESREVQQ
jgi:hypothetical protein